MKIERHTIDDEYMKDMPERARQRFTDLLHFLNGNVRHDPSKLPLLIDVSLSAVSYELLVEPASPQISQALRIVGDATAALFAAAIADGTITVRLGSESVTYESKPDESQVHIGQWMTGFFTNLFLRNIEAVDLLAKIPVELVRKSTTVGPEYLYLFMRALQSFALRQPDLGELMIAALKATDPKREDIRDKDCALNLHVPQLEVLMRLATKDTRFSDALAKGVKLHKEYYSKTKMRRRDYLGYWSLKLTALASLAKEWKLPFDVESPYLPLHLAKF